MSIVQKYTKIHSMDRFQYYSMLQEVVNVGTIVLESLSDHLCRLGRTRLQPNLLLGVTEEICEEP